MCPSPHRLPAVPRGKAAELSLTLDAIRTETSMMKRGGELSVSADDLIGAASDVSVWIAELATAVVSATTPDVTVPDRGDGSLQHVVYTLSALLVWADELREASRLHTEITADALAAWALVEIAAGLPGRTAMALDSRPSPPPTLVLADPSPELAAAV